MPIVQSALNNSIVDRLGKRCPLTVFTGHEQDTPLLSITRESKGVVKVLSLDKIREKQQREIESVQAALNDMHKDVGAFSSKKRSQAVASHNRKTNVRPANFTEGDFVLRGILQRERTHKPSLKWMGPYRVLECRSDYIFLVESLLNGKKEEVHGRRLKFFRNKDFKVTEEVLNHLAYQEGELLVIDEFLDIRSTQGSIELLVKWRGFSEIETDWVSLQSLREDVPDLHQEYIHHTKVNGTKLQRALANSL